MCNANALITHEQKALSLGKALTKRHTVAAMNMLDYILPQVAKQSRTLISSLDNANLHTL